MINKSRKIERLLNAYGYAGHEILVDEESGETASAEQWAEVLVESRSTDDFGMLMRVSREPVNHYCYEKPQYFDY